MSSTNVSPNANAPITLSTVEQPSPAPVQSVASNMSFAPKEQWPCSKIPTEEQARHKFPEFPQEAFIGILAEFAELYSRHYESPKEFFYFSAIVVAAIAMSGRVRADFGELESFPRLYGFKIGPSGVSKKTTADKLARKFVMQAIADATARL